jgi:hypothetical protein
METSGRQAVRTGVLSRLGRVDYEEAMNVPREGGCACGAVRYRLTSDPLFVHWCHCLNCQRGTGSAFVVNLLIESDRVELLAADPHSVEVPRDDGSTQTIFRCPTCQVAVFSNYGCPEVRFVRAGTLDDPSRVAPTFTSSPDRRSAGSHSRRRCPRSRSTTTRKLCGRRPASSGSRRSWRRRMPTLERRVTTRTCPTRAARIAVI